MTQNDKFNRICEIIENELHKGYRRFAIFPFGINGMLVKDILVNRYAIKDIIIFDNKLCDFRTDVKSLDEIGKIDIENTRVLITIENGKLYDEIMEIVQIKIKSDSYVRMFPKNKTEYYQFRYKKTMIGKYSYGKILEGGSHPFIKSVGNFCSFADGVDVVQNHFVQYISTHPFLHGMNREYESEYEGSPAYDAFKNVEEYFQGIYFPGIVPKSNLYVKRISIGNDVWLGKNVIITNYADIGDGVIAGAGSIITKDVPDFAIVVGVPAKIIKYRFEEEQRKALKKIAWWNWDDKKIIDNYDDFFIPVDQFIEKHL